MRDVLESDAEIEEARASDIADLIAAHDAIIKLDGDRDEDNQSALTCEATNIIAKVCLRMAIRLGWDEVTRAIVPLNARHLPRPEIDEKMLRIPKANLRALLIDALEPFYPNPEAQMPAVLNELERRLASSPTAGEGKP